MKTYNFVSPVTGDRQYLEPQKVLNERLVKETNAKGYNKQEFHEQLKSEFTKSPEEKTWAKIAKTKFKNTMRSKHGNNWRAVWNCYGNAALAM